MNDKLKSALRELPREVHPSRDLWSGIEARLARRPRAARPLWAYSLAASVLLAVAAGALWSLGLHHGIKSTTPQTIVAQGNSQQDTYLAQRAAYAEQSVESATDLAPATRQVILKNLRIIESSMQNMQAALDQDPNNPRLRALLFDLYQNEARLLAATQQAQAKTTARNSL
ncbi:MAG TPA: hypothetical protein VLV87_11480 [Gammaproteobacteria bacterium]|nr:hypothetical protein [Gammaproteobacteria bacterium]